MSLLRENPLALAALQRDAEPELFEAIWNLPQRNFREVKDEAGRGYNASRAYQSLYRHGSRQSVERAVLNEGADGFGRLGDEGRLDLTYEWFVLNPHWKFPTQSGRRLGTSWR